MTDPDIWAQFPPPPAKLPVHQQIDTWLAEGMTRAEIQERLRKQTLEVNDARL